MNKLIIKTFSFFILSISLFMISINCSDNSDNYNFFDIKAVSIKDHYPKEEFLADPDLQIYFEFNKKMNKKSLESAFSYEEDGAKITGNFKWTKDDHKVTFYPEKNCLYGKKYRISVGKNAEDINGNDMDKSFELSFQLGEDTVLPYVITANSTPAANSHLNIASDLRLPVIINFSEPMDKKYPYSNLSVSPDIEGVYEWLDGAGNTVDQFSQVQSGTLRFTPVKDYTAYDYYTVTVKKTFTDQSKNALREEYSFKFFIGNEFVKPSINSVAAQSGASNIVLDTSVINQEIEKNSSFVINFSEAMNKTDTENAISFYPSTGIGDYLWSNGDQTLTVTLKEDTFLEYQKIYKLTIKNTAKDASDNNLDGQYEYQLLINGNNSTPPELAVLQTGAREAGINSSVTLTDILTDNDFINYKIFYYNCITWNMLSSGGDRYYIYFILKFKADNETDIPPYSALNRSSVINNLSISSDTEGSGNYLDLRNFGRIESSSFLYDPDYESYLFTYALMGNNQGPQPDVVLRLKLTGIKGVCDINKNFMTDTTEVLLTFRYQ